MVAAAAERDYVLTGHRGVHVDAELTEWADLVLAMDRMVPVTLRTQADDRSTLKLALYLCDADVPDLLGSPPIPALHLRQIRNSVPSKSVG